MTRRFNIKRMRALRQHALLAGGLLTVLLLGLAWLGFPGVLARRILAGANEGGYFIEAHHLRLDLRGGLKASDVMVYRKGVVGEPFLEARELRILYRVFERPRAGISRVKALQARGGVLRPDGGPAFMEWSNGAGLGGEASAGVAKSAFRVIDMDVMLRDFEVMGVYVDRLHATLHVDRDGMQLSGLSGVVGRDLQKGPLEGNVVWRRDRQATGRLSSGFDPRVFLPACRMFHPEAAPILERFSFSSTPPHLELSFEAQTGKAWSLHAKGRIQAARYAYRGAGIGFANISAEYVLDNGTNRLKLDPFLIVVGGRNAEGKSDIDFKAGTSDFEVMSSIDLATVLRLAGVKDPTFDAWRLDEGARVMARGHLDYHDAGKSLVEASVEGARIGYGAVSAGDYGFRYTLNGGTNRYSEIRGKIGNGSFSGSVVLTPGSGSNLASRVRAELIHVDAEEMIRILTANPAWRADGKIYGNIELEGVRDGQGLLALAGQGQMTLRNSHLFRLPLFNDLMAPLERALPGLDFPNSLVDAHFTYESRCGRVFIRDLQIDDGPVVVSANGSCGFDGTLDFRIQVHLMKKTMMLTQAITGMLTSGKGLEFTLDGTLSAPRWSGGQRR